jgi:regulatory protein
MNQSTNEPVSAVRSSEQQSGNRMIIIKITATPRSTSRCTLHTDEGVTFTVSVETVVKLRLVPGKELDPDTVAAIRAEEEQNRAMDAAGLLLRYRMRSRRELEGRLRLKKSAPALVSKVLARIEELGMLDDTAFARSRAEYLTRNGKGPAAIRADLYKKGIPRGLITAALSQPAVEGSSRALSDPAQQRTLARAAAQKKFISLRKLPAPVQARRLAGFLARRGFSPDIVHDVVKSMTKEEEPE